MRVVIDDSNAELDVYLNGDFIGKAFFALVIGKKIIKIKDFEEFFGQDNIRLESKDGEVATFN